MTVTYYPHIATVKKGVLFGLLLRWKGSLYKLVLPEILAFLVLYSTLSVIYRYGLTHDQRCAFEGLCIYLHAYMNSTSITFSLGFFVSFVMNRWWETFRTMPWLYTPAYVIRQIILPPRTSNRPCDQYANSGVNAQRADNPQLNSQTNNLHSVALNSHPNEASSPNQLPQNVAPKSAQSGATTQPTAAPNGNVQHASSLPTAQTTNNTEQPNGTFSTSLADKTPESAEPKKGSDHASVTNALYPPHIAEERRKMYEDTLSVRLTLMRYLLLAWIFAIRRISAPVMIRFKPTEKLSDAKLREKLSVLNTDPFIQRFVDPLITEQEQDAIVAYARLIQGDQADTYEPDHYLPLSWATDLIHEAYERGYIASCHLVCDMLECFKDFRGGLGMLRFMDQFNIPLVYTQVVALSMYIYFVIVCFAQQFLDSHSRAAGPTIASTNTSLGNDTILTVSVNVAGGGGRGGSHHDLDLFLPLPSILYLMFLLGWLRVAEVCLNPFGEDDDDFPTWQILNMNVETAFKIINVFELDRVYDGSLLPADRRAQREPLSGPAPSAFIAATANQVRALRARAASRRSSTAEGFARDRRRESISVAPVKCRTDLPPNEVPQEQSEALLHELQDRGDDHDVYSEHSDAFSCYFEEPLGSVRRINYEHLRKKYERPFYLGGALETEMQQNPASIQPADLSAPPAGDFHHSQTSRVTAFARHIGSALHLPGMQRQGSRITMTTRDAPDDVSRVLHTPLLPYQSSSTVAGSTAGPHSRRPSISSASHINPTWRVVGGDQGTNRRIHKHSAPTYRLSGSPAREISTIPASPCSSPQHDAECGSLSHHSGSHTEMHQDSDLSPMRLPRASSSSSFASCTDSAAPRSLAPAALATSSPDTPGIDCVPQHTVGSRHNLNRIVEAIEIDCDAQSTPAGPTQAGH